VAVIAAIIGTLMVAIGLTFVSVQSTAYAQDGPLGPLGAPGEVICYTIQESQSAPNNLVRIRDGANGNWSAVDLGSIEDAGGNQAGNIEALAVRPGGGIYV